MNDGKIDLNEIASRPDHQFTITPRDYPAEIESRLRIEEANAAYQHQKDLVLHAVALLVVLTAFGLCVWAVVKGDPNTEKWAVPLLSAIVTGLVGYVTGRSAK